MAVLTLSALFSALICPHDALYPEDVSGMEVELRAFLTLLALQLHAIAALPSVPTGLGFSKPHSRSGHRS